MTDQQLFLLFAPTELDQKAFDSIRQRVWLRVQTELRLQRMRQARRVAILAIAAVLLNLTASAATAQVNYPLKTFLPIVISNSVEGQAR